MAENPEWKPGNDGNAIYQDIYGAALTSGTTSPRRPAGIPEARLAPHCNPLTGVEMTDQVSKPRPPQRAAGSYRTAAILLAINPPVLAAICASDAQGWDLFERSGAMTSMIGLLLAARHYLHRGVVEIAARDRSSGSNSDMTEILEDIHATKLGLAVSAFGTLIWGAGKYLQWWTFGYLVIWAAIAARDSWRDWAAIAALDAWRDFVRMRDFPVGDLSQESPGFPGAL